MGAEQLGNTVKVRFVTDLYEIGDWYTLGPIEKVATHSFSDGDTPRVTIKSGSQVKSVIPSVKMPSASEHISEAFSFEDGDEVVFEHTGSIDGIGLKKVELIICEPGEVNCKTRPVKLNGLESFWFND